MCYILYFELLFVTVDMYPWYGRRSTTQKITYGVKRHLPQKWKVLYPVSNLCGPTVTSPTTRTEEDTSGPTTYFRTHGPSRRSVCY